MLSVQRRLLSRCGESGLQLKAATCSPRRRHPRRGDAIVLLDDGTNVGIVVTVAITASS